MNTGDPDSKHKVQLLSGVSSNQFWLCEGRKSVCKSSFVPDTGHISILPKPPERQTIKNTELTGKDPALLSSSSLVPVWRHL